MFARVPRGRSGVNPVGHLACLAGLVGLGFSGAGASAQGLDCNAPPLGAPEGSEICDLGIPFADYSYAYGVSADGRVVVGLMDANDGGRAFRWTEAGTDNLGTPFGGNSSLAEGISDDGTVVVGASTDATDNFQAFRWTQAGGMVALDTLPGSRAGFAKDANADGSVVVGRIDTMTGSRAVRWTEAGVADLGTLEGVGNSSAFGVNADGSVVVGQSSTSGRSNAFRWTAATGMVNLAAIPGESFSAAYGVNADGSVVVGEHDLENATYAFRWTEATGMASLGAFAGGDYSAAYAVNADGSVVVGEARDATRIIRAFRWTEAGGMVDLGTLTGDNSSTAYGVSANGKVIVGESSSNFTQRAFIWRAADWAVADSGTGGTGVTGGSGGTMEDFANLTASFPILGNDTAVAAAEQQSALGQMMVRGDLVAAGRSAMATHTGGQSTGRNPTTVGARTTSLAALSFGRGISDSLTLGATLSVNGGNLKNNAFDMDAGMGAALWAQYSAGGAARTGLQVSGALGYLRSKGEVARGRLLMDVLLATGRTELETSALQASLAYGYRQGNWLITPSLGLAQYTTRRAAYTESGAAFNASYDATQTQRRVGTLAVTGTLALSEVARISLGAGLDHETQTERARLTGTSDIPGLTQFDISSRFTPNPTRAFATLGYAHDLTNGATVSGDLRVGEAVFGTTPSLGLGITYGMRF